MSNNLAIGTTLQLLEQLKSALEEGAAQAAKLNERFVSLSGRERRRAEGLSAEQSQLLHASLAQVSATFQTARTAQLARFEQRKVRIGQAYQNSKNKALQAIEDQAGGCKYELQKQMLQAERERDAGLAATTQHFQQFRQALAIEQQRLAGLELNARSAFSGYRGLHRLFAQAYQGASGLPAGSEDELLEQLRHKLDSAGAELERFKGFLLMRLLRYWPLWVAGVIGVGAGLGLTHAGNAAFSYERLGGAALAVLGLLLGLRFWSLSRARSLGASLSSGLAASRRLHEGCFERSEAHYQQQFQQLKDEFVAATQRIDQELKVGLAKAGERRVSCRMRSDERTVKLTAKNEQLHRAFLGRLENDYHDALQCLKQSAEVRLQALTGASQATLAQLNAESETGWSALQSQWSSRLGPLYQGLAAAQAQASKLFAAWDAPELKTWQPPAHFGQAARFGELRVDLSKLCQQLPKDRRLPLPGPSEFALPLCLTYPEQGSILFETSSSGHQQAIESLNLILLRLLSTAPPGRLNFTILDPVGLGQNFAGVMHLADYEEQLIHNRIWTQSNQIEEKLAELNEHMEKVIQMYLRNEYASIAEYNQQAGVIAEKYHFLVVADFPANFSETAAKRLLSIAASGARCGVFTLIHWDRRLPLPQDFLPEDLRRSSVALSARGEQFVLTNQPSLAAQVVLDPVPSPELATELIHQVGRLSRDSSRVEVPFEHVAPSEAELWSQDTRSELRVPIGRTGATKLQYVAIGKGTCQHGLVAGKTGSGKSTLFHVLITNLALWCSPEQVEFYLVDFKKGVEFKCYATQRLPHARVVAIESDREFGLSVLQRVDEELKRRGDLFRQLGVQDLAGYKRAGGTQPLPRTLLLVDEFQEFFVEDDKVAQTASLLMDRIVRQGRAFGIHVLLGSQTLGGAYTVARTTLGQMVIRIALQCNEADAYLIMDDSNPAPRLLSRPGEGIYNDKAGAIEGNSPFQVVWLPEAVRDSYLAKARALADASSSAYPGPLVFEGNAPADATENPLLRQLLDTVPSRGPEAGRFWMGAPNSIKGPTEAAFRRQSGNNLLIVGQREEAVLAIMALGLTALAAQFPAGQARFILCDASAPDSPARELLEKLLHSLPHPSSLVRPGELVPLMKELQQEMRQRAEAPDPEAAPPVFLFIHALQKFARLRFEEEFGFSAPEAEAEVKPGAVLNELVCEGTRLGFHVLASCDTYNTVNRFLSRKAFSEFELRVLFQMSANDSASLIDSPKAGLLGLHRALFFNAQEGYLETFRPYALPPAEWLQAAAQSLAARRPRGMTFLRDFP